MATISFFLPYKRLQHSLFFTSIPTSHGLQPLRCSLYSPSSVSENNFSTEANTLELVDHRMVQKRRDKRVQEIIGNAEERSSKRIKSKNPAYELRIWLDMCSRTADVMGAIGLYDSAVRDDIKLEQYHYNVLLYLCSSAAIGVVHPAKSGSNSTSNNSFDDDNEPTTSEKVDQSSPLRVGEEVRDFARRKGYEIYEKMCLENVPLTEAALTSVARLAMSVGDGNMAFEIAKKVKVLGLTPRLRSYSPALFTYCENGDVVKAFEVESHMLENGVQPEEPELEALLKVSMRTHRGDKVYYVLHKLRTSVRQVSPSTAGVIEEWFWSSTASRLGKRKCDEEEVKRAMENGGGGWHGLGWLGSGKWNVERTQVDADGLCNCCAEKLVTIDLDPIETENFANSVASIACKREKHSSFQAFQKWLAYYGPFEAVVDAANVGLFSQRRFSITKVNAVANAIRQKLPSKRWPLIIVHNRRIFKVKMDEQKIVEKWKNADAIYATPTGSNDDWYWLYAAIKCKALLVTNDEMRDHIFQVLGNDFFPKWKERHQVHFSYRNGSFEFDMPPPCSVVIQESVKGHWHIPLASEDESERKRVWLCATRVKAKDSTAATKTSIQFKGSLFVSSTNS